jgi:hypothetical protein
MEGDSMTYIAKRRRPSRRRPPGLGDWWSDLMNGINENMGLPPVAPSDEAQCIALANATMGPFDAKINDLAKNWNPTGYYTTDELRRTIQDVLGTVTAAQAAIDRARSEPNASQDSIMRAVSDLARVGERSLVYLDAARSADDNGVRLVNSVGFKRWVTDSLAACSSAMVTAAVIGCITPWWVGSLATFQRAFDKVWSAVKLITGAVLAIGETALEIIGDLPALYNILKYTAVAAGLYILWDVYIRRDRGGTHAI